MATVQPHFCSGAVLPVAVFGALGECPFHCGSYNQNSPLRDQRRVALCCSFSHLSCNLPSSDLVCYDWLPSVACILCSIIGKWKGRILDFLVCSLLDYFFLQQFWCLHGIFLMLGSFCNLWEPWDMVYINLPSTRPSYNAVSFPLVELYWHILVWHFPGIGLTPIIIGRWTFTQVELLCRCTWRYVGIFGVQNWADSCKFIFFMAQSYSCAGARHLVTAPSYKVLTAYLLLLRSLQCRHKDVEMLAKMLA